MADARRSQSGGPARPDRAAHARPALPLRPRGPAADREWVREAVARFERPLVRYAAHITGDVERGRDVAQEAFLRLCEQDRDKVEPHLAEWLYTVCRNLAIDVRRKETRMRLLTEAAADVQEGYEPAPSAAAEVRDSYASALQALEDLPANQQEVIRLKFQHGMSYKQISRITQLSVTNVGFLLHVGLKALRRQLAGDEERGQPRARFGT